MSFLGESSASEPSMPSIEDVKEFGRVLENMLGDSGRATASKVAAKLSTLVSPTPTSTHFAARVINHFPTDRIVAILFPELPPWLATACWLSRLIAFLILAPILLVGLVDFAEYAVVRTLGMRRRKLRVKPSSGPNGTSSSSSHKPSSRYHNRMRLSPAQMRKGQHAGYFSPAPLLAPGAYDADALLRHRARSTSSASFEALEEWQRTGGSFARVSEVRMAASSASGASSPEGDGARSPSARASVGVDGPLGLSESDAEDSGAESGSQSPEIGWRQRQGLKHSMLNFTPMETGKKQQLGLDVVDDGTPRLGQQGWVNITSSSDKENETVTPSGVVAAAMAADLEPDFEATAALAAPTTRSSDA